MFQVFDIAGLDLIRAAVANILPTLANSTEGLQAVGEKVARGELGLKSGKGFYEWTPEMTRVCQKRLMEVITTISRFDRPAGAVSDEGS